MDRLELEMNRRTFIAGAAAVFMGVCDRAVVGSIVPPRHDVRGIATPTPIPLTENDKSPYEEILLRNQMNQHDLDTLKNLVFDVFRSDADPNFTDFMQALTLPKNSYSDTLVFSEYESPRDSLDYNTVLGPVIKNTYNLRLTEQTSTQTWKSACMGIVTRDKSSYQIVREMFTCSVGPEGAVVEHWDGNVPETVFEPEELPTLATTYLKHPPTVWSYIKDATEVLGMWGEATDGIYRYVYSINKFGGITTTRYPMNASTSP